MPEFVHPLAQFAQGVQGGINLGLQVDQAKRLRRQQEWERDLGGVKVLMDYAGTKGATNTTKANAINQANGILKKYYPDMQLPTGITAEEIPDYGDVLKAGGALMKDLEKDPSKFQFAIAEWGRHNSEWAAKGGANAERTAAQKDIADQITSGLKTMGDASGQAKEGGGGADSPSKIKAEIFRQYLKDPNSLTPQQSSIVAEDLVDPAFKIALTAYGQNLSNLGNKPEEQLAQLKAMAKTIRAGIDEQARAGAGAPPAGQPAPAAAGAAGAGEAALPPEAVKALQAANGKPVKFRNGQTWTIEGGVPKRIE